MESRAGVGTRQGVTAVTLKPHDASGPLFWVLMN